MSTKVESDVTSAQHREQMKQTARDAFKDHQLTKEGEKFYCHKPGTGYYSFWVVFAPYYVVLLGDCGELTLHVSDFDSLRWMLTSTSLSYVMEKATHEDETFFVLDALAYLDELIEGGDERAARVKSNFKESIRWGDDDAQQDWYEAWESEGSGRADVSDCTDPSSRRLLQFHALQKFSELYKIARAQ